MSEPEYVMVYKHRHDICQLPNPPLYKKNWRLLNKWELITAAVKILLVIM